MCAGCKGALCFVTGLLVALWTRQVLGQTGRVLQDLVESLGSQEAAEALAAELEYLRANPLDLNRASAEELAELPWISDVLADSIVRYRDRYGPFRSVHDLETAGLLDASTLDLVAPYLFVRHQGAGPALRVRSRIEKIALPRYQPPWRRLARVQLARAAGVSAGVVAESDPGERRTPDFLAGYAAIDVQPNLSVVLGDYSLRLGQGLLFGAPYSVVAGPDVARLVVHATRPLRDYTYNDEHFALRGGAALWARGRVRLLGFASRRLRDGAVDSTTGEIRLVETGYHRTALEQSRRQVVREQLTGAGVSWRQGGRAALFGTVARQVLALGDVRATDTAVALDGRLRWAGAEVFGESAWMTGAQPSWIAGLRLSARGLETLFLAHSYQPGLTGAFRSNPFGGRRTGVGQTGALAGFRLGNSRYGLAASAGEVARRDRPGPTQRFLLDAWTRLSDAARLSFRLRDRRSEKWARTTDEVGREHPDSQTEHTTRARVQLDLGRGKLVAQIRAAVVWAGSAGPGLGQRPEGKLLYEQLRWRRDGTGVTLRFAVFDVRSSAGAVYAYEPGLPGTFAIRRYAGSGWRTVLLFQQRVGPVRLSLRLARTEKAGTAGSAFHGRDVGLQVDGEFH